MSGPADNNIIIDFTPIKGYKVAYTLNSTQPVRSTLIGEEPIFFMDHSDPIEEEGLFDMALLESLTSELGDLQKKVAGYEALSRGFKRDASYTSDLFSAEMDIFGAEAETQEDGPSLDAFLAKAAQSRILKTLLDFADKQGVSIAWSAQAETADYDRKNGVIFINPNIEEASQILLLGAQLRQVWQHKNGVAVDPMAFYPDHGILINRLQAADLSLFMIRAAWELQLADVKSVWELVENSALSDLGRAFAREVTHDFRTLNNGRAGLSVIESWFLSERCRKHDRSFIQRMLAGAPEGGFNSSEELSRQATLALICKLGDTPYGQNYLSGHITTILDDPIFYEVRDRSNANFLWFIKFENSFKEAEDNIQEKQGLKKALAPDSQKDKTSGGDMVYNQASFGEIISFPKEKVSSRNVTHKKRGNTASERGTILPFG